MSYKNIKIINKDGKTYHPQTNISNVLGINEALSKNNVSIETEVAYISSLKNPGNYYGYFHDGPADQGFYLVEVYENGEEENKIITQRITKVNEGMHGSSSDNGRTFIRGYYFNNDWSEWKEITNTSIEKDIKDLKQSGVETNKILVDALNSKEVPASTNDSIRTNVEKVKKIESNYDWSIQNELLMSGFEDGHSRWEGNQNAHLISGDDGTYLEVFFLQTHSTPGIRRREADLFLTKGKHTASFYVKQSDTSNSVTFYLFDDKGEKAVEGPKLTSYAPQGFTKYTTTFNVDSAGNYQLMILSHSPKSDADYMCIKDIMIEKGSKANSYRPFTLREKDCRTAPARTILTGNGESKRFSAGYYSNAFHVQTDIRNLKGDNIKKGVTVGGVTGTYEPKIGLRERTYYYYDLKEVSGRGTKYLSIPKGRSATDMMYGKIEGGSEPGYRWGEFSLINGEQTDGTSTYYLEKVVPLTPDSEHIEVTVYNWKKEHEIRITVLEPYIIE